MRELLKNPMYARCNAWARTTQKLRSPKRSVHLTLQLEVTSSAEVLSSSISS